MNSIPLIPTVNLRNQGDAEILKNIRNISIIGVEVGLDKVERILLKRKSGKTDK